MIVAARAIIFGDSLSATQNAANAHNSAERASFSLAKIAAS